MSSKLTPFPAVDTVPPALLKNPPDAIPPLEELQAFHNELERLKQKTIARARKATEDLRVIEESMKRAKEREKGKARALEKVKKEHGCTYHWCSQIIPI